MRKVRVKRIPGITDATIEVTGSKSETNRLLILQAMYPQIRISNHSNSDDSVLMTKALNSQEELIDIHHAGTAMRFLTAYFAIKKNKTTILTGSQRMQERPIEILVNALKQLGCNIEYLKEEGYPPIKIIGTIPKINKVTLAANVSSQYISALMLIASSLPNGLTITLDGKITSVPYINMTLHLLKDVGIMGTFEDQTITIHPQQQVSSKNIVVESDWSSASYFYSIAALSEGSSLYLSSYKKNSYQGDSVLVDIYKKFGIHTTFTEEGIRLEKLSNADFDVLELDLSNAPDIAQTIAVTCFGLGKACYLTGLHTLKIKETDRLEALKTEIEKLGGKVNITEDTLELEASNSINEDVVIKTYNDHRMAMAFAPLALRNNIIIENADVVTKSFPDYWSDLKKIGFEVDDIS